MKQIVEKEENIVIGQELLSLVARNEDNDSIHTDTDNENEQRYESNISDLNIISDLLMKQVENGTMSDNDNDDDNEQ